MARYQAHRRVTGVFVRKPKGMHWHTFVRLQSAHNAHEEQAMAGMSAKLGIAMARLEGVKYNAAQFEARVKAM